MVSLWGNKDDSGENERAEGHDGDDSRAGPDESTRDHGDADERTRLLPQTHQRRPRRDGYLDPDDPAVSPYNLWTVRFIRYISLLFFVITFIWWVLLLIALFVTPPGLHTRGSGFTPFAYATLTAGNLLVSLLFFTNPSQAMRASVGIIAGILLIDVILIGAISHLRAEEGWVGLATVIWASLMAIWCAVTDRVVAWGKKEEEERLTGRPESRHTLKEWIGILTATVILIIYIIIAIFFTATLILRARDAGLAMDGRRYSVDGGRYKVHLACVGEPRGNNEMDRKPTILLEAPESPVETDFEHWAYSSYQNGTISRYCYWDRPGYAWSDCAPSPQSAGMSADALSEALTLAGEEGPWIVVAAGYGSIVSRIFSARHLNEVKGMLLIDPLHEDLLDRVASALKGFKLWGWGVLSPLGFRRLIGALFEGKTSNDRIYGDAVNTNDKYIKARLQENLVADSITKNEVESAKTIQGTDLPFAIVSSGLHTRKDREWQKKQEDLTKLTENLVAWDVVKNAPPHVWQTYEGRRIMEKRLKQLVKRVKA